MALLRRTARLPAGRDGQDHVSPRAGGLDGDLRLRRYDCSRVRHAGWRHPLADAAQKAAAPLGAGFTFICLVTGSLWGKPMWGTYWVWDARLTSVLVLFILYLGLNALWRAIDDPGRAAKAAAILTLVGAVDLPIIKFSVDWWNTLHQPASVFRLDGPTIAPELLMPLLVVSLAFTCLFLTLHLMAIRNEILRRRIARVTMLAAVEGDRLAPEYATRGA